MTDAITIADELHSTAMERGAAFLLNAMKLERGEMKARPVNKAFARKDFLWSYSTNTNNQWTGDGEYSRQRAERVDRVALAVAEKDRIAEQRRVNRDPCFMCGTRGDIGCNHRRAA